MNLLVRHRALHRGLLLLHLLAIAGLARGADLTWNGAGDGFTWGDADNWLDSLTMMAPALPPGASDNVVIGSMSDVEVNNPAGVNELQVSGAELTVNDVLTIADNSEVDRLVLDGNISNSGELKIQGESEWKNGQMLGAGDVVIEGELTVDAGAVRLIQGKTLRNVGEVYVGTQILLDGVTWQNEGLLTLDNSISQQGLAGTKLINTGTISPGGPIFGSVSVPLINNGGTLKSEDLTSLHIDRRAELNGGLLDADGHIDFSGPDDHLFAGAVSTSGAGLVSLSKDLEVTGTLTNGLTGVNALLLLQERLFGSGTLVNNGNFSWEAGNLELAGGVTNNSVAFLDGSAKMLKTTFRNNLSTAHRTGTLNIASGKEWINESSSQYSLAQVTGPGNGIAGDGTFINRGRLVKSESNITNISSLSSHESAMIDVDEGELRFNGQSSHTGSGTYTVASGAKLIFNDETHTFGGQTQITGEGTLQNDAPSQLHISTGSTLQVDVEAWQLSGDVVVGGEVNLGMDNQTTWIDSTLDLEGGSFINNGIFRVELGNSHMLAGSGVFTNQRTVFQSRAVKLVGTGGGIVNESGQFWVQESNITFVGGATGKSIENHGTWRAMSDATIFDPGGILANNTFENSGMLEVEPGVELTIHTRLNSQGGSVNLQDGIVPPPPSFIEETKLVLTGGGEFINTPVTLGSNSQFDLSGTGATKTYLFDGAGATVTGDGSRTSVFRIGPGARLTASDLTLDVGGALFNRASYPGAVLDGGELAVGSFTNAADFSWRSGEIAADFTNIGLSLTSIEGNSPHVLKGEFRNTREDLSGTVVQSGPLTIDGSGKVTNEGIWFMQRGAGIAWSGQSDQSLTNNRLLTVSPGDDGGPHVATINAPFINNGIVEVKAGAATSSTLNLTANTLTVVGGVLSGGTWTTGAGGTINFPEGIEELGTEVFLRSDTSKLPELSTLRVNKGTLYISTGEFEFPVENQGTLRYGKLDVEGALNEAADALLMRYGITTTEESETDSAVDQSDGVTVPSIVAPLCSGGCPLPTVAIDVGTSQFTNGGLLLPGSQDDPGAFPLIGDFVQLSTGVIEVDLAGLMPVVEHDLSLIYGAATLDGTLDVHLIGLEEEVFAPSFGDTFTILDTRDGLTGEFNEVLLPGLDDGLGWNVSYTSHAVALEVILPGDFNNDGIVNLADYTVWRDNFGAPEGTLDNDPNPGAIGVAQYTTWKANFGNTSTPPGTFEAATVPEPCSVALLGLVCVLTLTGRRR